MPKVSLSGRSLHDYVAAIVPYGNIGLTLVPPTQACWQR